MSEPVLEASRKARTAFRSARRVVVGARRLSPRATAGWAVHQARRVSGPAENSSLTWVVASEHETTRLWLHNYWSDAYGIDRPVFTVTLLDVDGSSRASWDVPLDPDATLCLDVREECRRRGVGLPFEGQMLMVLAHDDLMAGRPVQLFAEYVGRDGECSGVHGQYGLMRAPLAQRLGGVRVDPGQDVRNGVVLVNGYEGPGAPVPLRPVLEVLSADGDVRRAPLDPIPPRGMARVYVDEVIPDVDDLLWGRPGQVRAVVGCPSSRILTFAEHPDGRRVVNHGTVDRMFDQGPGVPPGWAASQPVVSAPVVCTDQRDTVVTLPNVWGPSGTRHRVEIRLFRPDGSTLTTHRLVVAPQGTGEVSLRQVALDAGAELPLVAHAEIRVGTLPSSVELPALLDVVVGLRDRGRVVGEAQVGGEFFNAEVPPGVRLPDIRRTRVFTRVRTGGGARTHLFLAHPGPLDDHDQVAHPVLTLLDASGRRRTQAEIDIPVHGCRYAEVTELFPDWHEVLGDDGCGAVRVRDTGARLYGFHLVDQDGTHNVTIDHLVGG